MITLRAVVGLSLFAPLAVNCGSSDDTEKISQAATLVNSNPNSTLKTYLFSVLTPDTSPDKRGRCWYKIESNSTLTADEIAHSQRTRLTPSSIEDTALAETMKRSMHENLIFLGSSTLDSANSCSVAVASVIATLSAFVVPGAQEFSPFTAASGTWSLINCGSAGKAATDGLWNAYYFSNLTSATPKADVNAGINTENEAAADILMRALFLTRFQATGNICTL